MGLFKRNDSPYWWYYIELDGRKITGSTGTSDKRLAERIHLEKRHQTVEARAFPTERGKHMRFDAMCRLYMDKHAKVNKRSWRDDEIIIAKLLKHFGSASLSGIAAQRIEEYKASRKEHVKDATINRELTVLKTIFSKAILWGYAAQNPVKQVRFFKDRPGVPGPFEPGDGAALHARHRGNPAQHYPAPEPREAAGQPYVTPTLEKLGFGAARKSIGFHCKIDLRLGG